MSELAEHLGHLERLLRLCDRALEDPEFPEEDKREIMGLLKRIDGMLDKTLQGIPQDSGKSGE